LLNITAILIFLNYVVTFPPHIVIIPSRVGFQDLFCENRVFILEAGDDGYCAPYPLSPLSGFREDCVLVSHNLQSPERSFLFRFVALSKVMMSCCLLFRSLLWI
jgi:hypothetical protein